MMGGNLLSVGWHGSLVSFLAENSSQSVISSTPNEASPVHTDLCVIRTPTSPKVLFYDQTGFTSFSDTHEKLFCTPQQH
ncbi:hypothetical protein X801_02740, partial [Opisthorchis viverrini]